VTFFTAAE